MKMRTRKYRNVFEPDATIRIYQSDDNILWLCSQWSDSKIYVACNRRQVEAMIWAMQDFLKFTKPKSREEIRIRE